MRVGERTTCRPGIAPRCMTTFPCLLVGIRECASEQVSGRRPVFADGAALTLSAEGIKKRVSYSARFFIYFFSRLARLNQVSL